MTHVYRFPEGATKSGRPSAETLAKEQIALVYDRFNKVCAERDAWMEASAFLGAYSAVLTAFLIWWTL